MDDIYKSISVGSVSVAQADAFNEGFKALDQSPSVIARVTYDAPTRVLSVYVGIPNETPSGKIDDFISRITILAQNTLGKAMGVASDIAKGSKITTARDMGTVKAVSLND